MIRVFALILCCQLAGEAAARSLALPVPGPVLGMAGLFVLMLASPRVAQAVRPVGDGILRHLSLLFVPAGVGIVGHLRLLGENALAIGVALIASTVLAIAVGALVFRAVARLTEAKPDA
ncbi:Antiholin-like protein LrgA [Roseibaca ekhonensis]|uniref:Antiholin-like protein LrgA n=1 Tax=Roseinatronobacter ekhonensis TaxID=254356 RepID=A0A3B0M2J0_9RHOB|nr:CidA/LrgA family protein [Roseibaca ekhonensis]SUZ30382.1 Antiholin-like protein LrgA [Roseibaca ekhonensis]